MSGTQRSRPLSRCFREYFGSLSLKQPSLDASDHLQGNYGTKLFRQHGCTIFTNKKAFQQLGGDDTEESFFISVDVDLPVMKNETILTCQKLFPPVSTPASPINVTFKGLTGELFFWRRHSISPRSRRFILDTQMHNSLLVSTCAASPFIMHTGHLNPGQRGF